METILSVAIIGAIFTGFVEVLKVLFGGNKSKAQDYAHQEKIIELVSKQNDNGERLLAAIDNLNREVGSIRNELSGLNERVLKLEERQLNS